MDGNQQAESRNVRTEQAQRLDVESLLEAQLRIEASLRLRDEHLYHESTVVVGALPDPRQQLPSAGHGSRLRAAGEQLPVAR